MTPHRTEPAKLNEALRVFNETGSMDQNQLTETAGGLDREALLLHDLRKRRLMELSDAEAFSSMRL